MELAPALLATKMLPTARRLEEVLAVLALNHGGSLKMRVMYSNAFPRALLGLLARGGGRGGSGPWRAFPEPGELPSDQLTSAGPGLGLGGTWGQGRSKGIIVKSYLFKENPTQPGSL